MNLTQFCRSDLSGFVVGSATFGDGGTVSKSMSGQTYKFLADHFLHINLPGVEGACLRGDVDADLDAGSVRLIRNQVALVVNLF